MINGATNSLLHCLHSLYSHIHNIIECGLDWTGEQIKLVFGVFDKDKSGSLIYDEFLREVRGIIVVMKFFF